MRDIVIGPVDHVVSYAPTEHLYGRLYAQVLPELAGIPVTRAEHDPAAAPELPPGARSLLVCLPATWAFLERHAGQLAQHGNVVALHSTGPTTAAAHRLVARLSGSLDAHELLGSTETGAVAHRRIAAAGEHDEPWHLLPDVRLLDAGHDGERQLHVAGPRLARREGSAAPPDSVRTADLVVRAGDRSFHHVGRATRLIKVNGMRCDLGRIEFLAARCGDGLDAACAAVPDALRGEHYELYYASPDPGLDPATLRTRLAGLRGPLPAPRDVHRVPHIPRSSTGKVLTPRLATLACAGSPRPAVARAADPTSSQESAHD